MPAPTTRFELPPAAYAGLSALTLMLGLAAAALTAYLFIIGLHHTDKDPQILRALSTLGVLFTVAELVCFYATTALPKHFWKARTAMVVLGVCLIVFEIGTVAITQLAFAKSAEIATISDTTQATELRATIDQKRTTIASIRKAGEIQAASRFKESRAAAQEQFDKAIALENELAPLQTQLATLDKAQQPTLASILKSEDALLYFILLRATLLASIIAAMTAASGSLFRHFLNLRAARAANPDAPLADLLEPILSSAPDTSEPPTVEVAEPDVVEVAVTLEESLPALQALMLSGEVRPSVRDLTTRGLSDKQARTVLQELTQHNFLIRVGNGYIIRKARTESRPLERLVRKTEADFIPAVPTSGETPQTAEARASEAWHKAHGVATTDDQTVETAFGRVPLKPAIASPDAG